MRIMKMLCTLSRDNALSRNPMSILFFFMHRENLVDRPNICSFLFMTATGVQASPLLRSECLSSICYISARNTRPWSAKVHTITHDRNFSSRTCLLYRKKSMRLHTKRSNGNSDPTYCSEALRWSDRANIRYYSLRCQRNMHHPFSAVNRRRST